jgi:hypothetical protein
MDNRWIIIGERMEEMRKLKIKSEKFSKAANWG